MNIFIININKKLSVAFTLKPNLNSDLISINPQYPVENILMY